MIIRFDYDSARVMMGTEAEFAKWDKGELNSGVIWFSDLNLYQSVPLVIEVVNMVVGKKKVTLQEQADNKLTKLEEYEL